MTIVVGYVPRRDGLAALEAAAVESVRLRDRLVVVTAPASTAVDPRDVHTVCRALGLGAEGVEIEWVPAGRTAAQGILDAAAAHDAALVVVGLRGGRPTTGPGRSATAATVIVSAACPVLAVREVRV